MDMTGKDLIVVFVNLCFVAHLKFLVAFACRIVRLNPDVLIRDDRWLLEQMAKPEIHAIFLPYDMGVFYDGSIHSDFYAFRPRIYDDLHITGETMREWVDSVFTAEMALYRMFGHLLSRDQLCKTSLRNPNPCTDDQRNDTIVDPNSTVAIIPHVQLDGSFARMLGTKSPILHVHGILQLCPNYFNVTDGVFY
jgi:hypothetical protein